MKPETKKILMINRFSRMIGGIERYMLDMAGIMKTEGWQVDGCFSDDSECSEEFKSAFDSIHNLSGSGKYLEVLEKIKLDGFKIAVIHKLLEPEQLEAVISTFPITIIIFHDHDYYCMRHHKYFPYKRINCPFPFRILRCSLCSGMLSKSPGHFPPVKLNSPFLYAKRLKIIRKATCFMVLSEYMKNNLISNGFSPDKIRKVYPFIDLPQEETVTKDESSDSFKLLYAGQIIRGKGLDLLLEALPETQSNFILRIVGRGNDEDFIKNRIQELGIETKVDFKGFSSDMAAEYGWADAVVVPSRWQEPFGLIGVEAFARKLPVIGFDVGGISEWLKDGVKGILVEAKNSHKLAEAIDLLAGDGELRKTYGRNGFDFVAEQCSRKAFIEEFNNILGLSDV